MQAAMHSHAAALRPRAAAVAPAAVAPAGGCRACQPPPAPLGRWAAPPVRTAPPARALHPRRRRSGAAPRAVAEQAPPAAADGGGAGPSPADVFGPAALSTRRAARRQADWPAPEPALRLEAGERDELRMLAGPAAGLGLAQAAAADGSLHVHMVQWYPGHIARAERQLKDQLKMVDVVLEVRDARIPVSTWHPQVAAWVGAKPSLLVMNRVDMIGRRDREAWAAHYKAAGVPVFWTDGREGAGVQRLRDAILSASVAINAKRARRSLQPRPVRACVIGFPNIGKSALINRLLSRKARRRLLAVGGERGGRH